MADGGRAPVLADGARPVEVRGRDEAVDGRSIRNQ